MHSPLEPTAEQLQQEMVSIFRQLETLRAKEIVPPQTAKEAGAMMDRVGQKVDLMGQLLVASGKLTNLYAHEIDVLRAENNQLIALIWKVRKRWWAGLLRICGWADVRADDVHEVMMEEDRALNREFLDVMHLITNPHLRDDE